MPNRAKTHGCHVYIDLPVDLRDRFKAAAKANGLTMGEVVRYTIQVFVETAEQQAKEDEGNA